MSEDITIGGQFYTKFIDPTVTAANDPPFVYLGEGSPELFIPTPGPGTIYPASQYPHVEITPSTSHTWRCEGPACESFVLEAVIGQQSLQRPIGWYSVMHRAETDEYSLRFYCSLMCIANWLALELAKEESSKG